MVELTKTYHRKADTVYRKLLEFCPSLGLSVERKDDVHRRVVLSSGLSPLSWGETVEVSVSQHQERSVVTVKSRPKVWFNIMGERRAKRHVEEILNKLDEHLKSMSH